MIMPNNAKLETVFKNCSATLLYKQQVGVVGNPQTRMCRGRGLQVGLFSRTLDGCDRKRVAGRYTYIHTGFEGQVFAILYF